MEQASPAQTLLAIGTLLVLIGVGISGWAFVFDVSVAVTGADALSGLIPDRIANTDRLGIRTMILVVGAANYVAGWVMITGSVVAKAAARQTEPPRPGAD